MITAQKTEYKGFNIVVSIGKSNYIAWGKRGEIKTDDPVEEGFFASGEVWIQFGETREKALLKLKNEIDEIPQSSITNQKS